MEPDMESLLNSILNIDPTEQPECQSCQDDLHAYIDAELDGEDAAALFPEIGQHLAECQACREAYEELKALLLLESQGTLAEPPLEPTFDISYLEDVPEGVAKENQEALAQRPVEDTFKHSATKKVPLPAIWEHIDQQTKRLLTEITVLIGPKMGSFGPLPSPLMSEFVPVLAGRDKASDLEARPQILHLPSSEHDLPVSLKIGPVSENEITLSVSVRVPPSQPSRRARVTLQDQEGRMLESERTGENDEATFHQLGAGHYRVEIKYQDQSWTLPLTLAPEEA